jgi:hypothetical protein
MEGWIRAPYYFPSPKAQYDQEKQVLKSTSIETNNIDKIGNKFRHHLENNHLKALRSLIHITDYKILDSINAIWYVNHHKENLEKYEGLFECECRELKKIIIVLEKKRDGIRYF